MKKFLKLQKRLLELLRGQHFRFLSSKGTKSLRVVSHCGVALENIDTKTSGRLVIK